MLVSSQRCWLLLGSLTGVSFFPVFGREKKGGNFEKTEKEDKKANWEGAYRNEDGP